MSSSDTAPVRVEPAALERMLDGMRACLVITDVDGAVIWINRPARRLLGVEEANPSGQVLGRLLRDPNLADFWRAARSRDGVTTAEVRIHWPERRELKVNAFTSVDAEGARVGHVLLFDELDSGRPTQAVPSRDAAALSSRASADWEDSPTTALHAGLTPQELRVLRMVGRGQANGEIAKEMHVAPSTVRTHLKHAYAKLRLPSRSEAIHYAIRHGLA